MILDGYIVNKIWENFKLAGEKAIKSDDCRHYRLGCVARRADGATVFSCNGPTPVPTREQHAEYRISRKLDYNSVVYVARVLRDGSYGNAMPCASCMKALKSRRVSRVYFTVSNTDYGIIKLG